MVTNEAHGVMTSPSSDRSLVDGLHAGSRDAFERLYGDYHPAIYNLCARIVGDREEAKDLTQEVFIKAFSSPPAAGGSVKLRPWLYRVATNACFNHLRARNRIGGDGTTIDAARAPVDEYERAQTVALVEQSLGELNERYRTALVLRDLHGLPAGEIAEVMAVSRPAADVLVHRARAAFKTAFRKLGGDTGAAPASLGLVLAPLSVPAALHALPPLPASLGATPHPPAAAPVRAGTPRRPAARPLFVGRPRRRRPADEDRRRPLDQDRHHRRGRDARRRRRRGRLQGRVARRPHRAAAATSQHVSDELSEHDGSGTAGSHWEGHGRPVHGHLGHRDSHAGTWSWQDDGHSSDGSGTTSHHASDGGGTSGTSTTHDGGGSTWSPSHDGSGGTSGTHESDSGW